MVILNKVKGIEQLPVIVGTLQMVDPQLSQT
jgi:hypothetical protein